MHFEVGSKLVSQRCLPDTSRSPPAPIARTTVGGAVSSERAVVNISDFGVTARVTSLLTTPCLFRGEPRAPRPSGDRDMEPAVVAYGLGRRSRCTRERV